LHNEQQRAFGREIMHCLKRYVAREIYRALIADSKHRAAEKSTEQVG